MTMVLMPSTEATESHTDVNTCFMFKVLVDTEVLTQLMYLIIIFN